MPVRGITFDKQVLKSEDHAHEVNYYYQGDVGVTKGCEVTENVDGNLVIAGGYFIICGRLVAVDGNHIVTVPEVLSGTKYRILVFEIDLTEVNTTSVFNQGAFKILESDSDYPTLTQQDLNDGGTLYQMEFARFTSTVSGIASLSEANKPLLDMSKYVSRTSPELLGNPTAPTQAFNDNTNKIATDQFVQKQVRVLDFLYTYNAGDLIPGFEPETWEEYAFTPTFTLDESMIGKLLILQPQTATTININLPIAPYTAIPIGSMFMFAKITGGKALITEGYSNIIMNTKKYLSSDYAVATLIKVSDTVWLLYGELSAT